LFGRARILLTIAAPALATPVSAQAPAPTTTAFDGKYIGTATQSSGVPACATMTSADMTIKGGQVIIHETQLDGYRLIFRGSVNAAGEISTSFEWKSTSVGPTVDTVYGTIRDKVFTGQHAHGHWCYWNVQIAPLPPPTMPFDGEYIGVSRESSKPASAADAECPPNGVPAPLTIWNGIVRSDEASWQGTVSPQGVLVLQNRGATRVDGQIDNQGLIRAQGKNAAGCALTFVWRKQSG
jgi:hypothetical protein